MTETDLIDRAYERGVEAGRIEIRVSGLEKDQRDTAKTLVELGNLINSTVTTVQLLAKDIQNRAESDRKMWEQRDKAADDTARAIRQEKDNAAKAIKDEKELTATTLANEVNKANIRWVPRMGWAAFASIFVIAIGAFITFYATYHK